MTGRFMPGGINDIAGVLGALGPDRRTLERNAGDYG
jgi:hypothetical protein